MAHPNVAFCRPLIQGSTGLDVIAHKRAISRNQPDIYPWTDFSAHFGPLFLKAVKTFQVKNGIQATGKIGKLTHETLEKAHRAKHPGEWAFDAVAIQDAKNFCAEFGKSPEDRVREAIVGAAFFWYHNRTAIAYSQIRPMQLGKPPWVPTALDCSAFATNCHYAGGAPDPNGRGYDHLGYTGTLMSRGQQVANVDMLKPGDLIFYGYTRVASPAFQVGDPTHVAVYVGIQAGTHSVISNGHYPMGLYPYNYTGVNHYRHYTVV